MKEQKISGKFTPIVDPEVILKGFGLTALRTKFYKNNINQEEQDDEGPGTTSYLGTPVFADLVFIPGEYKDKTGESIQYGQILKNDAQGENFVINTVLIDVSQQKQIIKTNIQGVAGTVKEYISKGDYQLIIRGALVSGSSVLYPTDQVQQLKEYLEAEVSLGVASRFLDDIFDVQNIVIESYNFPQREGYQDQQLFEISAISDEPIELTVLNK
tara:strand:- start:3948 stop:4589 length:642 start_codon:yes stop_codon:yes gene_type:complete